MPATASRIGGWKRPTVVGDRVPLRFGEAPQRPTGVLSRRLLPSTVKPAGGGERQVAASYLCGGWSPPSRRGSRIPPFVQTPERAPRRPRMPSRQRFSSREAGQPPGFEPCATAKKRATTSWASREGILDHSPGTPLPPCPGDHSPGTSLRESATAMTVAVASTGAQSADAEPRPRYVSRPRCGCRASECKPRCGVSRRCSVAGSHLLRVDLSPSFS